MSLTQLNDQDLPNTPGHSQFLSVTLKNWEWPEDATMPNMLSLILHQ